MQTHNKFNHNTKIIGVIGHPIKHSFSPLMFNISFELNGLNYIYLPFDVPAQNLQGAVKGMISLGITGFNITLPHKEKIIQYLSDVSEEASVIGAVNTVVNENGTLHGYNTDVHGVIETLNEYKDDIAGKEVTVIGAGGAARSAVYSLIRHFKIEKINIINRTSQTAESLKEYFSTKMLFNNIKVYELIPPDIVDVMSNSQLIINATAVGMAPEEDDSVTFIDDSFVKYQIVFDIVYNPLRSKLLKIAEAKGAVTLNGLKMFVTQGSKSYELWTGEKMPVEQIYKTLNSYLDS
ncbi:shikimate dehydrogenase [Bacteroidota bacterium]